MSDIPCVIIQEIEIEWISMRVKWLKKEIDSILATIDVLKEEVVNQKVDCSVCVSPQKSEEIFQITMTLHGSIIAALNRALLCKGQVEHVNENVGRHLNYLLYALFEFKQWISVLLNWNETVQFLNDIQFKRIQRCIGKLKYSMKDFKSKFLTISRQKNNWRYLFEIDYF